MLTASAVREAFRTASAVCERPYSPHSARHLLAKLGDDLCRSSEQRKAWSLNLGHSSEKVTWAHYGKVTEDRKREVFAEFEAVDAWTVDE